MGQSDAATPFVDSEASDVAVNVRVDRCVQMLEDDFHRQSQYLHSDDVNRLTSRLNLSVHEARFIRLKLDSRGIVVTESEECGTGNCFNESSVWAESEPLVSRVAHWPKCYYSHELLTHEEEVRLGRRVRAGQSTTDLLNDEEGNVNAIAQRARAQLILANLRLVIHCAKRHAHTTTIPLEDLVQDGICGLFRAIEKFEPERGFKFSTYATWWIDQCIRRSIELTGRTVRVPSNVSSRIRELQRKRHKMKASLGRRPSSSELAAELGWRHEVVNLVLDAERDIISLEVPTRTDGVGGTLSSRLRSKAESPFAQAEQNELSQIIHNALSKLDVRSRQILVLRFGLDGKRSRTLESVGKRFGITRERVRQIEKRALQRICTRPCGAVLRQYLEIEMSESQESSHE